MKNLNTGPAGCLTDTERPSVISTGADLEEAGSSNDITLEKGSDLVSAWRVCLDEVVRDGRKWGHFASAACSWRLPGPRARLSPSHGKTLNIFSRQSTDEVEWSIALQKEKRYMQSNKKGKKTTVLLPQSVAINREYYKGYSEAQGQLWTNTAVRIHFGQETWRVV